MNRYLRSTAVVFCLLGLLVMQGCGPSPQEKAAGTYALDKENIKKALEAEIAAAPEDQRAQMAPALAVMGEMTMSITLNADGTASSSSTMGELTRTGTGTWTLDGDKVSVTMSAAAGDAGETATGTLKGDTLELKPPETEMPFNLIFRKQAK